MCANLEPRLGGIGVRLRSGRWMSEYGIEEMLPKVEATS